MNLAFVNVLPFPALDGAARRRRNEPNREAVIHPIGFAVLIMLVPVVGAHDVSSWPGGK